MIVSHLQESLKNDDVIKGKVELSQVEIEDVESEKDVITPLMSPDQKSSERIAKTKSLKKTKLMLEHEVDSQPIKKIKKKDYVQMYNDLWVNGNNQIDIYSIDFKVKNDGQGIFKFNSIKKFENPIGAFVICKSNFNPPILSRYN